MNIIRQFVIKPIKWEWQQIFGQSIVTLLPLNTDKMVLPQKFVVCFSLILLELMITDGFQTSKCEHGNLTTSLRKLHACMTNSGNHNICLKFRF